MCFVLNSRGDACLTIPRVSSNYCRTTTFCVCGLLESRPDACTWELPWDLAGLSSCGMPTSPSRPPSCCSSSHTAIVCLDGPDTSAPKHLRGDALQSRDGCASVAVVVHILRRLWWCSVLGLGCLRRYCCYCSVLLPALRWVWCHWSPCRRRRRRRSSSTCCIPRSGRGRPPERFCVVVRRLP